MKNYSKYTVLSIGVLLTLTSGSPAFSEIYCVAPNPKTATAELEAVYEACTIARNEEMRQMYIKKAQAQEVSEDVLSVDNVPVCARPGATCGSKHAAYIYVKEPSDAYVPFVDPGAWRPAQNYAISQSAGGAGVLGGTISSGWQQASVGAQYNTGRANVPDEPGNTAASGCSAASGAKCIDLGSNERDTAGSGSNGDGDPDGYGAGGDRTIAASSGTAGPEMSGSGIPSNIGMTASGTPSNVGMRVTGKDAIEWTAGIQKEADLQGVAATAAAARATAQTVTLGGGSGGGLGGLLGGSGGGSSFLAGLGLRTGQIDKALGIAGKLGVDTSSITGGLATIDKFGGSNAGATLSGFADKASAMAGGISKYGSIIPKNMTSLMGMGNLNLGGNGDPGAWAFGKTTMGSVKDGVAGVRAGVDQVRKVVNTGQASIDKIQATITGGKLPGI